MVTMLATLNISKAVGEDGKEITPDVELTPGLTRYVTMNAGLFEIADLIVFLVIQLTFLV